MARFRASRIQDFKILIYFGHPWHATFVKIETHSRPFSIKVRPSDLPLFSFCRPHQYTQCPHRHCFSSTRLLPPPCKSFPTTAHTRVSRTRPVVSSGVRPRNTIFWILTSHTDHRCNFGSPTYPIHLLVLAIFSASSPLLITFISQPWPSFSRLRHLWVVSLNLN